MEIKTLNLINFRNFQKKSLDFDPKLTVIVGPNAAGKTNICEALWLLSSGRSFRARTDLEMINFGKDFARAELSDGEDKREVFLKKQGEAAEKKFLLNGVAKRLGDFIEGFNAVFFGPWVIDFLFDSPSQRRYHIDTFLSQIDKKYYSNLLAYNKVLASRNRLLEHIREQRAQKDELVFWNEKLVVHGLTLQTKRKEFFDHVSSKKANTEFVYQPTSLSAETLHDKLKEEIKFGYTLSGPHRDDFRALRAGRDLLSFGSRGEQRLAVLKLKLGEISFIEKKKEDKPLLILDDVFSELDGKSQRSVVEMISNQQTVVTSTEKDVRKSLPGSKSLLVIA